MVLNSCLNTRHNGAQSAVVTRPQAPVLKVQWECLGVIITVAGKVESMLYVRVVLLFAYFDFICIFLCTFCQTCV